MLVLFMAVAKILAVKAGTSVDQARLPALLVPACLTLVSLKWIFCKLTWLKQSFSLRYLNVISPHFVAHFSLHKFAPLCGLMAMQTNGNAD
jgi:hypothetical protein